MSGPNEPISVPALDLKAQYATIKEEVDRVLAEVVESQYFVLGPQVAEFEKEVAEYCSARRAIGCASGSDALLLPLLALEIESGDEVITTPYSFFATAGAVWRTGARPVFVDIDPLTFNIDPNAIEAAISPRTKAIIPVHLYGQVADMDPINEIAARHGLHVLEDAAQAIGAGYRGRSAGTLGDSAAFSFYPSKNLGAFGDAGMVTTNDPGLAAKVARLRVHGMEPKYHHHEVGFNSRLDALQAAVLRVKLRRLPQWTEARRSVAAAYARLFAQHALHESVTLPTEAVGNHHVFNQFVIRTHAEVRDELRSHLAERRIGTEIYYPIPLHLQTCFVSLGHSAGDFPHAETAAAETIALPIYPELGQAALEHVVGSIAEFYAARKTLPIERRRNVA
jgi:dTDP-4-amino-4,6-dideoxygalactose transaminase